MNDTGRRAESLGAGHAKADKPAGKQAKSRAKAQARAGKALRAGKDPRAAKAPKVKKSAPKFVTASVRFLKSVPGRLGSAWESAYDTATQRPAHAVRVLGVVVAVVAVLAGLFWLQTDRWSRTETARTEAIQAGEQSVGLLLSYSFRSIDRQVEKTQDLVTGKFKDEYAQFLNASVAPKAKDKQVVVRTSVDHTAVVDSSPSEVTLLMFIDQQSEGTATPDGVDAGTSGVRVTLEKEDGKWKVSELTPV